VLEKEINNNIRQAIVKYTILKDKNSNIQRITILNTKNVLYTTRRNKYCPDDGLRRRH
jgi:hypothetical protein